LRIVLNWSIVNDFRLFLRHHHRPRGPSWVLTPFVWFMSIDYSFLLENFENLTRIDLKNFENLPVLTQNVTVFIRKLWNLICIDSKLICFYLKTLKLLSVLTRNVAILIWKLKKLICFDLKYISFTCKILKTYSYWFEI